MSENVAGVAGSQPGVIEPRIDLRILSPGSGVPESIEIRDVPVGTQIAKLKESITRVAPSHPSPDTQRLIYQGHVLAEPSTTLQNVFGADAIRNNRSFTLHLVVRPTGHPASLNQSQTLPRMAPLQQDFPRGPPTNLVPQFPQAAAGGFNPLMPQMLPQGIPGFHIPGAQIPQPQTQAGQGQGQGGTGQQGNPDTQGPATPTSGPLNGPPQSLAQQHAAGGLPAGPQAIQHHQSHATPASQPDAPQGGSIEPQIPAGQGLQPVGVQQHGVLPNGMQYRMTVNHAFELPQGQAIPGFPQHFAHPFNIPPPGIGLPGPPQFLHQQQAILHQQMAIAQQQQQQQHMFALRQLARNRPQEGQTTTTTAGNGESVPTSSTQQTTASTGSPHQGQSTATPSTTPTVYLLSSPTGPHAVLFHPQGAFNSLAPQLTPSLLDTVPRSLVPSRRNTPSPFRATPTSGTPPAPAQAQPANQNQNQAGQLAQLAPPAAPAPVDANANPNALQNGEPDLLGPIQPFLGQLWLLFRIVLFAWFFLGGEQGWRRPLIIAGICLAFLLVRGVDAGTGFREWVRGWWEGLIGIPARREGNIAQGQGQGGGIPPPQQPPLAQDVHGAAAAGGGNAGEGAGQRRRGEQQLGPWRTAFRPVERALALFVASLWPGLGERTVRARREEEERVARELAEAEQRTRALQQQQETVGQEQRQDVVAEGEDTAASNSGAIPVPNGQASTSGVDTATGTGGEVRERHKGLSVGEEGSEGSNAESSSQAQAAGTSAGT